MVTLYVRAVPRKGPQLPPETHFARTLVKDVKKLLDSLEYRVKESEDDKAYFEATKESQTILKKYLTKSPTGTTLVTLLDNIDSKLLQPNSGLTRSRERLKKLPEVLDSLERKKALILLKVFTLGDLQDSNKTEDVSKVLDYLNVRSPERKERIITDAIGLAHGESEGDKKPVSSYMTNEYIGLLQGLKLDKTEIETIASTHENKTLDEWSTYITKKLALEKESKTKNYRDIFEASKTLPANNNTNNNGTHTAKATDKPVVASPLIAANEPSPPNGTTVTPEAIESNPDLTTITAPSELDLVANAEPPVINNIDQLTLKNYERFIKLPFTNYDTFLEKLLHELKGARIVDSGLSMPDFKSQLEERFGLNEDYYSERVKVLSAITRTNGHIQSNGFAKETELTLVAPKSLIDSLTDKDTGEINPRGHVLSIRSNIPGVRIVDEPDGRTMVVDNSESNGNLHQVKLNHALDLFNGGLLVICGSQTLQNAPIKVEVVRNSIGLACINSITTKDRIWGEYNTKTGELVFLGIAKSHQKRIWENLIQAYGG